MCSSDAAFIIRPRPSPPAPSAPTTCPTGSCTSTRATGRPWGTRQACKFEFFKAYFNFPTCSRQFSNMVVDCQFRGDDCMVRKITFPLNLSGILFFNFPTSNPGRVQLLRAERPLLRQLLLLQLCARRLLLKRKCDNIIFGKNKEISHFC